MWSTLKCLDLAINWVLRKRHIFSFPQTLCLLLKKLEDCWSEMFVLKQIITLACINFYVLDKNSFLLWRSRLLSYATSVLNPLFQSCGGIGRYSKDSRAFYLFQHFPLSCPFWLFRPAVLRQRFFVFCFLGQVVLGGFAKRNSIDNQCPGNKHFLLNILVLLIWAALATLQRYSVSPAEMLILLVLFVHRCPPCPCTNHSIKDTPLLFLPLSLATCHFLPYNPLPKKGNHKYWFLFSFSLKIFLDSVHTTSSDVKGDGESWESWSG